MKSNLNRLNHALNLWKRYLQEDSLSQFDRWLAKRFKENSKFGKKDRRAYSEILFSALRWGHRAVYELPDDTPVTVILDKVGHKTFKSLIRVHRLPNLEIVHYTQVYVLIVV